MPQNCKLVLGSHGRKIEFGAYFFKGDFAFVLYELVQGFLQVIQASRLPQNFGGMDGFGVAGLDGVSFLHVAVVADHPVA